MLIFFISNPKNEWKYNYADESYKIERNMTWKEVCMVNNEVESVWGGGKKVGKK